MNDDKVVKTAFIIVLGFFTLLLTVISLLSIPLRTRAMAKAVTFSIKLQGNHKPFETIKAQVDLYNGSQKVLAEPAVTFTNTNGIFTGIVALKQDFDFSRLYAFFIKPEKYVGRVFCKSDVSGKDCVTAQTAVSSSGTVLNLAAAPFLGGDIAPTNGKVDAQDISLVMKSLGKTTSPATDINGDGITDVTDYSLVLYSLNENAADDLVALKAGDTPPAPATATTAPSATGAPSTTQAPAPSNTPTATTVPTRAPTAAPTSQPSSTPVPTARPSATPIPQPTNTPVPASPGVCHTLPGPMASSVCGVTAQDVTAASGFSQCIGLQSSNPFCSGKKSQARCTCPAGKTCSCQLQDSQDQTVSCSNGGKFELKSCQ